MSSPSTDIEFANQSSSLNSPEDENESDNLLLEWNNHFALSASFESLLEHQEFVDVTLVSAFDGLFPDTNGKDWNNASELDSNGNEDDDVDLHSSDHRQQFGAHKVVLSACSPHLRRLLSGIQSSQHPVLIFRDVPPQDLEAILKFVYSGKVEVPRHQLTSFLRSADILAIRGLSRKSHRKSTKPSSPQPQPRVSSSATTPTTTASPHQTNYDPIALTHEDAVMTDANIPEGSPSTSASIAKRPRLTLRPPPKPVTTTITPALLKIKSVAQKQSSSSETMVIKTEMADNNSENHFAESKNIASTSGRTFEPDSRTENVVIPSLVLDSSSLEDIGSAVQSSSTGVLGDNVLRNLSKNVLCPLCRAVLSNVNALSYHMNYLHGISDPQLFTTTRIKDDLS